MKTVKARITVTVLSILIISYLLISLSIYIAIGSVYRYSESKNLNSAAERISNIGAELMGKISVEKLPYIDMLNILYQDEIDAYSKTAGYYIITADKYNRVIYASENAQSFLTEKGYPTKYIADILNGEEFKSAKTMSDYYDTDVITAGVPVEKDGEIVGAILCSLPAVALSKLRTIAMRTIALTTLTVLFIGLIIAYFLSLKITKPISEVSKAAKMISGGDFSQRVNISAYESEIGELAANFNEMAQALENSDKIKSAFISDVSHELRTPMTTIIGFLQGIADGVISEEEHGKYINICLEESKRLSRLVTKLLEITRLESDEEELNPSRFDFIKKIRFAILKFEKQINDKHIKIYGEYDNTCSVVFADEDGIERVLINLIDNAVKFTDFGGEIIITTKEIAGKLKVSVSNSGQGIDADNINSIWDKFYKGDKSRSSDVKGTGLGLYFAKKILSSHGEKISVTCEKTEKTTYTTFKFELKLSEKENI